MNEQVTVLLPFNIGKKFAFDMSIGRTSEKFEVLKPYVVVEEDNEVKIVLEFSGFTIHHTIAHYEKMLELGTGYLDVEECKKLYPNAEFVYPYRRS